MRQVVCPHCRSPIERTLSAGAEEVACPGCGSAFRLAGDSTADWAPHAGRLGRFELLETLGSGAFGTVLKARDPELDRTVALKVPRPGTLDTGTHLDRFLREARSAAQLRHPGIVTVHEVGQADGVPFLVSDLVDGPNLADWLSAHRPTFRDSARLVADIADALQFAHDHGVVHRDVKPANILLGWLGERSGPSLDGCVPHVTDFGLARRDASEVTMTLEGQVLGTPAYMSPEQARGDSHGVDGRCDVYSLGAVLYQMLTGELPFRGSTRMILHQLLHDDPRPPRSLNDRVPRDLETICLKAMAREPHLRYRSAAELADDLRRFLAGEPVRARSVGWLEKGWRWSRRNPAVATLTAAVVVSVLAGLGFSIFFAVRASAQASAAEGQKLRADENATAAEASAKRARAEAENARRHLYTAHMNLADLAWAEGNVSNVLPLLDQQQPKPGQTDLRHFEWHQLHRLCHDDLRTLSYLDPNPDGLPELGPQVSSVAFSPDGRHLAGIGSGPLRIWDVVTGQRLLHFAARGSQVVYSPDGRRLAVAGWDGHVGLWSADGGEPIRVFKRQGRSARGVAFSPDGSLLASVSNAAEPQPGEITVWDVGTGEERKVWPGHAKAINGIAFSPDGRRLVTCGDDGVVKLWDATSGEEVRSLKGGDGISAVALSRDGKRVVAACHTRTPPAAELKLWDAVDGRLLHVFRGHAAYIRSVAISPNGRQIVSVGFDGGVKVWDAETGQNLRTLRGHTGWCHAVVYSPDGRLLASAGNDAVAKLWDASSGQEHRVLKHPDESPRELAFSPDSQLLAAVGDANTIQVWHTRTAQEVLTVPGQRAFRFSPDGRLLGVAGGDREIVLWDIDRGLVERSWQAPDARARCLAFNRAGDRVTTVGDDGVVRVWDALTGKELQTQRLREFTGTHRFGTGSISVTSADGSETGPSRLILGAEARYLVGIWSWGAVKVWSLEGDGTPVVAEGGNGAALSPDERSVAVGHTERITVYDTATGAKVRELLGHTDMVRDAAISADGRRVVSSGDRTIRFWDFESGQLLRTLPVPGSIPYRVALSSDGNWLIAPTEEGVVKLWDGRPLTAELRVEREAVGWLDGSAGDANVATRLRDDPTVSDAVRKQAHALLPAYDRGRTEREAVERVRSLVARPMLLADVRQQLRDTEGIAEGVRRRALVLAAVTRDDPEHFNSEAWAVARRPGEPAEKYRRALRFAELACRLSPGNSSYLTTLATAQFRTEAYGEALATLTEAERVRTRSGKNPLATDFAVLAMVRQRLGEKGPAKDALARLREARKGMSPGEDPETEALFAEAEAVVAGKAGP